jgi:pSer/pThr/pTyr-binding forkhead associated (FHA) protein
MGVRFVIRSAEGRPLQEEAAYGFEQARIVIGRGAGADVRIPHLAVSEMHATVRLEGDAYAIFDNDSTNGTWVNGVRLVPGRGKRLREGDRVEVGAYALSFHEGIGLTQPITMERTAELARRLFRQSQEGARVGAPRLCVLSGPDTGKSLEIPPPPARLLVGRDESCQLVLPDADISREHAELRHDLDGVLICNLESKNGLEINGQLVLQRRLRDGDEITLGHTRLLFEEPAEEPIDNQSAEADRPLSRPVKIATPAPAQQDPPVPPATSNGPTRLTRGVSFDADLLIYALAAIVIVLSIAGLIALIRAN